MSREESYIGRMGLRAASGYNPRMPSIRVVHFGLGPIGAAVAQEIAERPGLKIVGGIDIDPAKVGRDVGDVVGLKGRIGVKVEADAARALKKLKPHVVVLCTSSTIKSVMPQIETILKLSRRMNDLIESLLQYSRTGRVEILIERTDLDALVDEALISCEGLMAGAATEIRRSNRLGQANCDRVRIGEVFTNLISNAIKYNDKPKRWVEIGVEEGPTGRYYVADNGIGLEADERERIFEIFRRIHGPEEFGGGVGAGLTIARKIVERHGGRMWIDSEPNRGSIFYFTLSPEAAT